MLFNQLCTNNYNLIKRKILTLNSAHLLPLKEFSR